VKVKGIYCKSSVKMALRLTSVYIHGDIKLLYISYSCCIFRWGWLCTCIYKTNILIQRCPLPQWTITFHSTDPLFLYTLNYTILVYIITSKQYTSQALVTPQRFLQADINSRALINTQSTQVNRRWFKYRHDYQSKYYQ
jgi:hypothetical protein